MSRRIVLPNYFKDLGSDVAALKDQVRKLEMSQKIEKEIAERVKKEVAEQMQKSNIPNTPRYELDSNVHVIERPLVTPKINKMNKPRKSLPNVHTPPSLTQEPKESVLLRPESPKVLNSDDEIVSLDKLKNHI